MNNFIGREKQNFKLLTFNSFTFLPIGRNKIDHQNKKNLDEILVTLFNCFVNPFSGVIILEILSSPGPWRAPFMCVFRGHLFKKLTIHLIGVLFEGRGSAGGYGESS